MFSRLIGTKTFWTGLAGVAGGVVLVVNGHTAEGIAAVVGSIQTVFIRDAIAKSK
jgi:hypothetical protein